MTRIRYCSLFVAALVALAGCAGSTPLRTTESTPEVVAARFLLDVDGLEADFPDQGGGLIPRGARAIQTGRDVAEAVEALRDPEGSAVKAAQDSVYAALADVLGDRAGLRLLPLETLRGEVPYLVGAPMGRARDVVGTDAARGRRTMEIDVYVEVPDAVQGSWSFLGTGKVRVKGHPEMTVAVRMYEPDGRLAWKDRVRVRSRERVELTERWLLGIRTEQDVPDASSLPVLIRQATNELVRRSGRA